MWKPCTKVRKSKASKTVNAVKAIFRNTDTARYYCKNIVKGLPKPITHIKQCWSPVPWPLARHQLSCRTIRLRGGGGPVRCVMACYLPAFISYCLVTGNGVQETCPRGTILKQLLNTVTEKSSPSTKWMSDWLLHTTEKKWLKWLQSRNLKVN